MPEERKKLTVPDLAARKKAGEKVVMASIPDYPSAVWAERAGIDIAAVGDSLGMVSYGFPNTLPVTIDMMIAHGGSLARRVGGNRPADFCCTRRPRRRASAGSGRKWERRRSAIENLAARCCRDHSVEFAQGCALDIVHDQTRGGTDHIAAALSVNCDGGPRVKPEGRLRSPCRPFRPCRRRPA